MEQKIRELIKKSMIDKNKNAQLTYKSILENAQKYAKNDKNREVNNDDFIKAIKNEIKQLNDLLEFVKNDEDKIKEINEKISYCEDVLPKMVSEEEIIKFLTDNNIDKNIGICMKNLKAEFGQLLDGKIANVVVKQYIGG